MAFGEFTPWDKKDQYLYIKDISKDINTQREVVRKFMRDSVINQMKNTEAILASNGLLTDILSENVNINQNLSGLGFKLDGINEGINELKTAIETGFAEVIWKLELVGDGLKNIQTILETPLDTQSKEFRKRAEKFFAGGLIEEAFENFLEAEKLNKYDFLVHISLGIIYVVHKKDITKAEYHFNIAAKYAKLDSIPLCVFSLLQLAQINFSKGDIENAEKISDKAISLDPDNMEAYYLNGGYNLFLNNNKKAEERFVRCFKNDSKFYLKALKDFSGEKKNSGFHF